MRTFVIGCNHRTAPVSVRERLAFDDAACSAALSRIRLRFPCCESVLLSTCNRTELYLVRPSYGHPRVREAIEFLAGLQDVPLHEIGQSLYHYVDGQAIRHLFRVTSSLDSLVVGESQILAQAKHALELANERQTSGKLLAQLFQRAFSVAKEIHTATGIAEGHISVGSTAVDFARQIFASFADKTVLMIGAGEMGELTLRHVLETRPKRILVTNRTYARAEALAAKVQGEAMPFEDLVDHLVAADIVISSTGAPEPIIHRSEMEKVMVRRKYRPMFLVDIAVPRDIEETIGTLEQVFLYNVDDLQAIIESTHEQRRVRVARATKIIEASVAEFSIWRERREIGPLVRALDNRIREISDQELEWILPKLSHAAPHDRELVRQLVHRLSRKILHGPKKALNDKAHNGEAQVYAETLRTLFQLPDEF